MLLFAAARFSVGLLVASAVTWLILARPMYVTDGLAMYLMAPPYTMTDTSNNAEGKWTLPAMLQDLFKLGLLGVELPMDATFHYEGDGMSNFYREFLGPWGQINYAVFIGLYIYFVLISTSERNRPPSTQDTVWLCAPSIFAASHTHSTHLMSGHKVRYGTVRYGMVRYGTVR